MPIMGYSYKASTLIAGLSGPLAAVRAAGQPRAARGRWRPSLSHGEPVVAKRDYDPWSTIFSRSPLYAFVSRLFASNHERNGCLGD
jgi:hypothetical protein